MALHWGRLFWTIAVQRACLFCLLATTTAIGAQPAQGQLPAGQLPAGGSAAKQDIGQGVEQDIASRLFAQADYLKLYEERYWLLLLHYRNGKSEADGESFFFSKQGAMDPRAEMQASLKALAQPPEEYGTNQHPQCRFPARYRWLKERLNFAQSGPQQKLPEVDCPALRLWFEIIDPRSVSIVFASYYLNAPASMFGHTLLKLQTSRYASAPLLDYAINFAAYPDLSDPIRYALYGLLGGFPGRFAFLPYHAKVREYNDMESRDLWEYHLNLSRLEIERMLLHLCELDQTHFDYFYMDENCSYHLLSLIEVARPDLDLRSQFGIFTVPGETIRLLSEKGLLGRIDYRPSLYTGLYQRIESLATEEKELLLAALKQKVSFTVEAERRSIPVERRIFLLDTLLTALRFEIEQEGGTQVANDPQRREKESSTQSTAPATTQSTPSANEALYQELIEIRRNLPRGEERHHPKAFDRPPHFSHKPALAAITGGASSYGAFLGIKGRPLFHDLLAMEDGYERNSELRFLDFDLRWYSEKREPQLHRLHLLRIVSLSPYENWRRSFSYLVDIGIDSEFYHGDEAYSDADEEQAADTDLHHANSFYTSGLVGFSWQRSLYSIRSRLLLSLLGGGRYRRLRAIRGQHDQIIPEALLMLFWSQERWKYGFSAQYLPYSIAAGKEELRASLEARFSLQKNIELRSSLRSHRNYEELSVSFLYFF